MEWLLVLVFVVGTGEVSHSIVARFPSQVACQTSPITMSLERQQADLPVLRHRAYVCVKDRAS